MTDLTHPTRPELTCDEVRDLAGPFVLDALDPDEMDSVRAHLATCADAHAEIAELAEVLPVLAADVPVREPSAALKERIMEAAAADLAARNISPAGLPVEPAVAVGAAVGAARPVGPDASGGAGGPVGEARPAEPVTPTLTFPTAGERRMRAERGSAGLGSWALRIAAVLAIVALAGWNLLLQGQLGQARDYEQRVAAVLDVAGQPGALTAVLRAEGGDGPTGLAAVGSDGVVRIAMRDLAPTSGSQVYEAWVIGPEGTPDAIGGFRVDATGTGYFEATGVAAAEGIVLALTLEPAPGATAPSSAPVSLGTVSAG